MRQVEFYLGDTNLLTDKFMRELIGGSSNQPVPIKKICLFKRMRRFSPYCDIVSALKDSKTLKVTGDEGEELVERIIPFDPEYPKDEAESRTIYAKGFGDEESTTQFDIEAFFASYGRTNAVRLRRTREKLFKGSVFVEFADAETAQKFLNLPNKPLWKGEYGLKIMSKKEYFASRHGEKNSRQRYPASNKKRDHDKNKAKDSLGSRQNSGGKVASNAQNSRQKNNLDQSDWRKLRDEDRASGFKNDRRQNRGKQNVQDHRRKNNENKKYSRNRPSMENNEGPDDVKE